MIDGMVINVLSTKDSWSCLYMLTVSFNLPHQILKLHINFVYTATRKEVIYEIVCK